MRLHEHTLLKPLQGAITKDQYIQILEAFYNFYKAWEPIFAPFSGRFEEEINPLALLERDFEVFKHTPRKHSADIFLDINGGGTEIGDIDLSAYVGYLYVKQGSTLGGQVISKHLKKELGLKKDETIFYFNGYGERTGDVWRSFTIFLEQSEKSDVDCKKALSYARKAFISMEEGFSEISIHSK